VIAATTGGGRAVPAVVGIGDEVEVLYLGRVAANVERAVGVLAVELGGNDGELVGLVLETDSGATFIDRASVVQVTPCDS
jgi:hypothetical protein